LVVLAAIAVAICASRIRSPGSFNPMADLSDAEYRRRYELGRRRYLAERAVRKALRQAWIRDHGPWLLLALIAVLLIVVLGLTQPHRFIVITSLALYSGLAWVVCWAVRESC
jgi:Flp pilus assembly protein TadB